MPDTDASSPAVLVETVEVDAAPAQVWALVSDVPRMAEWSPQVVRSRVLGGRVRLGARFANLNRRGLRFWPTTGKVVRFEPHRDFAFRISENRTVWSFELEELESGGTRIVQRREVPDGISALSLVLTKAVLGGVPSFTEELRAGMRETLDRLRSELDAVPDRTSAA